MRAEFAGFSGNPIAYTPPAHCPGPWAKVVLTVDLTVTAGHQFDRTAEFILRSLTAADQVLTSVTDGKECKDHGHD